MTEMRTLSTYCPECDCDVEARLEYRREALPVKGEPTSYDAEVAICPRCGCLIGDSNVEEDNSSLSVRSIRVSRLPFPPISGRRRT